MDDRHASDRPLWFVAMTSIRSRATVAALAACVLLAAAWQNSAAIPLPVIDMASYQADGLILGAGTIDKLGQSIAAGDFNGDHIEDILVGADEADGPGNGRTAAGEAYVVFGSADLGTVDLASSEQDATILGADNNDHLGTPLATGDFNDDGFADAVIAARFGDGPSGSRSDAGEVYLIFGSAGMGGVVDTASVQQDVTIYGADAYDYLPSSVAVGDVNGDSADDLLLGTYYGDGPGNTRSGAGEAYVIFGSPTLSGAIDLAAGGADITVFGEKPGALGDRLGYGVGSGDFNGDGADDILVTAQWGGGPDNTRGAGDAYVIFGSPDLSGTVDIASSQQDFSIYGVNLQDEMGSAAAGDLNGDGVDDVLVVASRGDGPLEARPTVGEAYAVFGPLAQDGVVDAALSQQDLTIYGVDTDDKLAQYVYLLAMGDFNDDGMEDILVGSEAADGPSNARNLGGDAYVIFGRPTMSGTIDLALSEEDIVIYGGNVGDHLGSVAAGDVNGDGVDEVLVAAPYADGVGETRLSCGEAYVISLGYSDQDKDGILDSSDNCPLTPNPGQEDGDTDGDGDACDNCPTTGNPDQANHDADPDGDACDVDDDGDGFPDTKETLHGSNPLDPQCTNATNDDSGDDTKVNDGCAKKAGSSETGGACDDAADSDGDTWANDGCPLAGTRGEGSLIEVCDGLDNDGDTQVDDGYPDTNPGGPKDCMDSLVDTDGDTLVNTGETNDDDDGNPEDPDFNDGWFSDTLEAWNGTDSLDGCPENSNDDAWPPDFNNDGRVQGLDILFLRLSIASTYGGTWWERDRTYNRRYDLNMDGVINGLDVLFIRPYLGLLCSN